MRESVTGATTVAAALQLSVVCIECVGQVNHGEAVGAGKREDGRIHLEIKQSLCSVLVLFVVESAHPLHKRVELGGSTAEARQRGHGCVDAVELLVHL